MCDVLYCRQPSAGADVLPSGCILYSNPKIESRNLHGTGCTLSLNVFNPGEIASTAGTSGVVYGVNGEVNYDQMCIRDRSSSMRFMATVTISVPDARIDCSITSSELNFPVPKNRRELNLSLIHICKQIMRFAELLFR